MSDNGETTLNQFIDSYKIPSSFTQHLCKAVTLNASEVLTRQGKQQIYGYLVDRGILRAMHYSEDGSESCKEYYFKNELSFLYAPWIESSVADFQIEALTDVMIIKIPLAIFNDIQCQYAKIKLLEQQLLYKEAKEKFFLLHTPQQRYHYMLEHFPQWISQLNNQQLAAYIGVSPVSLSRIKSR